MPASHVDTSARLQAATLLRSFLAGGISNTELDQGFPQRSRDPAIHAVYRRTFRFQDDIQEFHATGRFAVEGPAREVLDRCVLFLQTELAYEWSLPLVDAVLRAFALLTRRPRPRGDRSVWPFFRKEDLASAAGASGATFTP
jgi:hypothetical protein